MEYIRQGASSRKLQNDEKEGLLRDCDKLLGYVREAADLKGFKHQNLLRKVSFDVAIRRGQLLEIY